tara:strand:+ start:260 stop:529 length:270 start_codon:yes stop_codon:yes gene_type:complete
MSEVIERSEKRRVRTIKVIVNAREVEIPNRKHSFLEIVQLAFPGGQPSETCVFTVTFSHPRGRDGSLDLGDHINPKRGTIFNVGKTDKS